MSCEKYAANVKNEFTEKRNAYINNLLSIYDANTSSFEKIIDFPKYATTESLRQFLTRYELVKLIKDVPGDIVECGVCGGRGLLSLLQSHLILEPCFFYRKVIGIDTFTGFVGVTDKDNTTTINVEGDFAFSNEDEIRELGRIHSSQQYVGYNKVHLVKGDATQTIPEYIEAQPHTLIALLYLDFDIYKPTKVALENFVRRMPKGAIIAFDEIHFQRFPGETLALLECFNINHREIKNVLHSNVNYFVVS
jgi:hypothetical protein